MPMSISNVLIYVGVFQGVILGLALLFSKYFQSRANRYLAITLLTGCLMAFLHTLTEDGTTNVWIIFFNDIMWEYLYPATLFLYFAVALNHPISTSKHRYWLFLPFILTLFINIFIDLDVEFHLISISWLQDETLLDAYYLPETIGVFIFALFLIIWSRVIIRDYPPPVPTNWFAYFWAWSSALSILNMLFWGLGFMFSIYFFPYLFVGITLLFFWITYTGILKFNLLVERFEIKEILNQRLNELLPQQVSDTKVNDYFFRLEKLMKEEHLYRNPELNRELVAQRLKISIGYLSQKLKENTDLNFSEYVNAYRVEEVKKMLVDPKFSAYSILAIGYEAGFNSKSTYYAAFKKLTGMAPSSYRNEYQRKLQHAVKPG